MTGTVARLAPEQMVSGALWYFCRRSLRDIGYGPPLTTGQLRSLLQSIELCLQELELRGEQLELFPEKQPAQDGE